MREDEGRWGGSKRQQKPRERSEHTVEDIP